MARPFTRDLSIKLEGAKELERKLTQLNVKVQRKLLRQSVRAAAQPIRKIARAKAPRRKTPPPRGSSKYHPAGKELWKSIKVRSAGKVPGLATAVVVKTGPHGHLLEFGTVHSPAFPFLRPAFELGKRPGIEAARQVLASGIEREARK